MTRVRNMNTSSPLERLCRRPCSFLIFVFWYGHVHVSPSSFLRLPCVIEGSKEVHALQHIEQPRISGMQPATEAARMATTAAFMCSRITMRASTGSVFAVRSRHAPVSLESQSRPWRGTCRHHSTTSSSSSTSLSNTAKSASAHSQSNADVDDCPELPSTPSWSLRAIMVNRDRVPSANDPGDHSRDPITPETINHLIKLAHLRPPSDKKVLDRLQKDVIRLRNFLDYIRDYDLERPHVAGGAKNGQSRARIVGNLRSLVDDGKGLQMRIIGPDGQSSPGYSVGVDETDEQAKLKRRDVLLSRPQKVKGNFFVVKNGDEIP